MMIHSYLFASLFPIEQKCMTFDHDFGYSFLLLSSILKREGKEKENKVAKIVIKSHAFLLDPLFLTLILFLSPLNYLSLSLKEYKELDYKILSYQTFILMLTS